MPILSEEIIERIKEEKREEIRKRMRKNSFLCGLVAVHTGHMEGCGCYDCLTNPEPFFPFPEQHKKFIDSLFAACAEPDPEIGPCWLKEALGK